MYVTCIKSIMHLMHKEKTYLNDNLDTGFCVSFTLHNFPYQQYTMAEFLTFVQKILVLIYPKYISKISFHLSIKVLFWMILWFNDS